MTNQSKVSVAYNNLTPAEKARVQAHIQAAMQQINYRSQNGLGGAAPMGPNANVSAAMNAPYGSATPQQERKQPQDKVLRLVTSRDQAKRDVTWCVIWACYMMANAILVGWKIESAPWWSSALCALPTLLGFGFFAHGVRSFFKRAEAKADMLDWPQK